MGGRGCVLHEWSISLRAERRRARAACREERSSEPYDFRWAADGRAGGMRSREDREVCEGGKRGVASRSPSFCLRETSAFGVRDFAKFFAIHSAVFHSRGHDAAAGFGSL